MQLLVSKSPAWGTTGPFIAANTSWMSPIWQVIDWMLQIQIFLHAQVSLDYLNFLNYNHLLSYMKIHFSPQVYMGSLRNFLAVS